MITSENYFMFCINLVHEIINQRPTDAGLTITAKTVPEHNTSTKTLKKNNFVFSEIVRGEKSGDNYLWTHKKED